MCKTYDPFIHGPPLPTECRGRFLILHQICSSATDFPRCGESTPLHGGGCPVDTALSANWIDGDGWCTQHFQQNEGLRMFAGGTSVTRQCGGICWFKTGSGLKVLQL